MKEHFVGEGLKPLKGEELEKKLEQAYKGAAYSMIFMHHIGAESPNHPVLGQATPSSKMMADSFLKMGKAAREGNYSDMSEALYSTAKYMNETGLYLGPLEKAFHGLFEVGPCLGTSGHAVRNDEGYAEEFAGKIVPLDARYHEFFEDFINTSTFSDDFVSRYQTFLPKAKEF